MPKPLKVKLRPMRPADLAEVLVIERSSFNQPFSQAIFEQELKIKAAKVWVALYRRHIVGYIDFWLVSDEIELVSIAVDPRFKRKGIGEFLMKAMLHFAEENQVRFVYLDVRESNLAAQRLYQKFDFVKVGVRRRYYSDNQEDAIMMKKDLL